MRHPLPPCSTSCEKAGGTTRHHWAGNAQCEGVAGKLSFLPPGGRLHGHNTAAHCELEMIDNLLFDSGGGGGDKRELPGQMAL